MLRLLAPVLGLLLAWAGAAEARMHAPYRGHRIVATGGAPLDTFTTPFAAYSFRKLRSAYTGPGIRLRRASDNAELDIGFLGYTGFTGAPLDVAAANAHCAATTCVVQTWYDQSGNARHVSNGTPANQPAFTASCSGLTGQPCITATSSAGAPKQLYTAASHTPVNPVSFSAVGRRPAGTALSCNLVEQYSANMLFVDGNSQGWYLTNGAQYIGGTAADAGWHAAAGVLNGAGSVLRVDTTETTGTATGSTAAGLIVSPTANAGGALTCNIVESIIWNGYALTPAERQALTANQKSFWGF